MMITHNHPAYRSKWNDSSAAKYNGAFYYSKEIVANIIPNVQTDRNWVTINVPHHAYDHSIVFVHNNMNPENYDWLADFDDLVLVCGVPETCDKVSHLGRAIYLPLSIDVEYVRQFTRPKTRGTAFAGRAAKRRGTDLPRQVDTLEGMKRQELLPRMAAYKQIYAVGRTAIEARALGCEILPYDPRYPDPSLWQVLDNKDAARLLQAELNRIDGKPKPNKETDMTELNWLEGFPERNGIYRCRIDNKEIRALAHKKCSINGRHRWMELDGRDAPINVKIEYVDKRLDLSEL